jgi:hypothetical protein
VTVHDDDLRRARRLRAAHVPATIVLNGDVGRCVDTSHDPDRGFTDLDTLGVLARYRREGRTEICRSACTALSPFRASACSRSRRSVRIARRPLHERASAPSDGFY